MIKIKEKIAQVPFSEAREAWIERARIESGRRSSGLQWMVDNNFVIVDVEDGVPVTEDGREIIRAFGKVWALHPEVHKERLAQAFKAEKDKRQGTETKSVVGTESLSAMVCPKCGDALQHTAVCPKCAAGKLGYRHRYTCVCVGVDLVSKDAL